MTKAFLAPLRANLTTWKDRNTGTKFPAIRIRGGGIYIIMDLTDPDQAYQLVNRLHDLIEEHERRRP